MTIRLTACFLATACAASLIRSAATVARPLADDVGLLQAAALEVPSEPFTPCDVTLFDTDGSHQKVTIRRLDVVFTSGTVIVADLGYRNRYLLYRTQKRSCEEQSQVRTDGGKEGYDFVYRIIFLALLRHEGGIGKVLHLGAGGGNVLRLMRQHMPSTHHDLVDLSPDIIKALPYFNVSAGPTVRLIVDEARGFLERSPDDEYDVILVDAESKGMWGVDCLATLEFFQLVRRKLAPGGVMVYNAYRGYERGTFGDDDKYYAAIAAAFPDIELTTSVESGFKNVEIAVAKPGRSPNYSEALLREKRAEAEFVGNWSVSPRPKQGALQNVLSSVRGFFRKGARPGLRTDAEFCPSWAQRS